MTPRARYLATGSLVALILSSCGSPVALTVEFDGETCTTTPGAVDTDGVRIVNRGSETVWIGAGAIDADATADSMLSAIADREFGANEAVMALLTFDEGRLRRHSRPG